MNPILVEVYREQVLESFHRGVACAVDLNKQVIWSRGDINQICYPRSAMKYFQVIPLLEAGGEARFGFTSEEIAIMCGSHNGEEAHVRTVRNILNKVGLDESSLQCGPQYPSHRGSADAIIRSGQKPLPVHNNCSGKHAGMLALCKILQADPATYLQPSHPVQRSIRNICEQFYEYAGERMITALDGCSAPIYAVPVFNQAIGFMNLARVAAQPGEFHASCRRVIDCISEHPFMVAGSKRYCTDMMSITAPRVIGKTGAEGVFCIAFTEEIVGVCIKIDDGKMEPQYNVAQAIIEASGIFLPEQLKSLHHYREREIINFSGNSTGEIKTVSGLTDDFHL